MLKEEMIIPILHKFSQKGEETGTHLNFFLEHYKIRLQADIFPGHRGKVLGEILANQCSNTPRGCPQEDLYKNGLYSFLQNSPNVYRLIGEWVNWCICTLLSAIKRNKLLTHPTTWMTLQNVVPSDRVYGTF